MKAKIKETGEIVDVYHEPQHGQTANIYKESVFVNGRIWTEDELIFINVSEDKEVDLEKELKDLLEKEKAFVTDNREVRYYNGDSFNHIYELEFIAKHFYELGLRDNDSLTCENEKIRKQLIGYFNQYIIDGMPQVFSNGLNVKDIITWLESIKLK